MKTRDIDNIARRVLSKERYDHSKRVAKYAAQLVLIHGGSKKKAYTAAMLHDTGYFVGTSKKDRTLSHARISAHYAKRIGIADPTILEAIRWHTVGEKGLKKTSKILYLADSIEPGRTWNGVERVRKLAKTDLNAAILLLIDLQKEFLNKKGKRLSPSTVRLREELRNQN